MATVASELLTVEEFILLPDPVDGSQLELIDGEVVIMPPPQGEHGVICGLIAHFLLTYVLPNRMGWVVSNDSGVFL